MVTPVANYFTPCSCACPRGTRGARQTSLQSGADLSENHVDRLSRRRARRGPFRSEGTYVASLVVGTATLVARTIEPRSIYDARLTDEEVEAPAEVTRSTL